MIDVSSPSPHEAFTFRAVDNSSPSVAVVEDHPLYRRAVCEELAGATDLTVLGSYGSIEEFARAHLSADSGRRPTRPSAVLLDLNLPGVSGAEGVAYLRAAGLPVLLLSAVDDPAEVFDAFAAGAAGFLGKHADGDEIRAAARTVAAGGTYVSATLAGHLLAADAAPAGDGVGRPDLTGPERRILGLLAAGETEQDVADELGTSVSAVRTHLERLRHRAEQHRRPDLENLDYQGFESSRARFPVAPAEGRAPAGAVGGRPVPVRRQLAALLEQLPVVLVVLDTHGQVTSISGSPLAGTVRLRCDTTTPVHLDELFGDGDPARPVALSVYRQALAGKPATGRYRWHGRWWEARGVPAYEHGAITGVLMVVLDITTQVEAEAARMAAEERFRVFMDRSPASVAIQHEDGRYVYVNDAARRAYGVPAEVVDFRPEDIFPAPVAADVMSTHERLMASGGSEFGRWEIPQPDGARIISGYRFCFTDVDGTRYEGSVGIDETESTRQREELTAWRDRYRILFDRHPLPMLVTGVGDGTVVDANPAFAALIGGRLSEVRGRSLDDYVDDPAAPESTADPLANGRGQVTGTTSYRRPDGSRVRALVTRFLVPGTPDGGDGSVVSVIQPEVVLTAPRGPLLTSREATILRLRARGDTNPQIATAVGLTPRGLDYHLRQLARKLRCPATPAALVARAYHLGLLAADAWPPEVSPRQVAEPES